MRQAYKISPGLSSAFRQRFEQNLLLAKRITVVLIIKANVDCRASLILALSTINYLRSYIEQSGLYYQTHVTTDNFRNITVGMFPQQFFFEIFVTLKCLYFLLAVRIKWVDTWRKIMESRSLCKERKKERNSYHLYYVEIVSGRDETFKCPISPRYASRLVLQFANRTRDSCLQLDQNVLLIISKWPKNRRVSFDYRKQSKIMDDNDVFTF